MKKIGIIGVGNIACGAHIPQLEKATGIQVVAVCDIDAAALQKAGDRLNIPADRRYKDYHDLLACDDIDGVEICTPNYLHVKMAADAVRAGKAINVEKPLGLDVNDTQALVEALKEHPVPNMMCFSYRYCAAVRYAKWIMEQKLLGDIVSVHVEYLKSSAFMEGRRLEWRFIKEYAGTGVLGDLGVHLIDMATFLIGDLDSVCATTGIVVKERQKLDSEEWGKVETDDYCNFLASFQNGTAGSFVISRCAIGNQNSIKYEIYGTKGMIAFHLNDPTVLGVCIGPVDVKCDGLHTVSVPKEFFITQEQMFSDLLNGKPCQYLPTVEDGVRCQRALDALLESSQSGKFVKV